MASLLSRRLISSAVQMENEDLTAVIADVENEIGEGNAKIAAGLQEVDMLGDTVDMLEAIGGSAQGLIDNGVEPEAVTTILTPSLVSALDGIDSSVAMQASLDLESDAVSAKEDKGEGFFKRIKDYAIKIWEAIRKAIENTVIWFKSLFMRFFDGATVINRKSKELLIKVKSAHSWDAVKFKGKGAWSVDFKDPTEKSFTEALGRHEKAMEAIKRFAEKEIVDGQAYFDKTIKAFEDGKASNNTNDGRKVVYDQLREMRDVRAENAKEATRFFTKGVVENLLPIGKAADYKDGNVLTTYINYRTVSEKDGYTAGEFDSFSKNSCISILQQLEAISATCIALNPLYKKAIAQLTVMQKKIEAAFKVYSRDIQTMSFGLGSTNKLDIEMTFKALFEYVSDDLKRVHRTWNNVVKSTSVSSLGNALDLMKEHYARCGVGE